MKYKLTDKTKIFCGVKLHQIVALKDFSCVKKGDLGGWVETADNLSQEGTCWVNIRAQMYDNSRLFHDAVMYGESKILDRAQMQDNSLMFNRAELFDGAMMFDNSRMLDSSQMSGTAIMHDHTLMLDHSALYDNAQMHDASKMYDNAKMNEDSSSHGDVSISGKSIVYGKVTKDPVNLTGYQYDITIEDELMTIGCETHSHEEWINFSNREILKMDGRSALKFWNKFKPVFKLIILREA